MKKLIILFTTLIFTFFWLNSASAELIHEFKFENNLNDSVWNLSLWSSNTNFITWKIWNWINFNWNSFLNHLNIAWVKTFSFWVKINELWQTNCNNTQIILSQTNSSDLNFWLWINWNGNLWLYSSPTINWLSNSPLNINEWYYITIIYSNWNFYIYKNLQNVITLSWIWYSTLTFNYWTFWNTGLCWLKGSIDELKLYNNSLTSTEITNLYNNTCTSWTLTPTQTCQLNWTQTLTASNPLPTGCTGWTPPTTQTCTYTPPTTPTPTSTTNTNNTTATFTSLTNDTTIKNNINWLTLVYSVPSFNYYNSSLLFSFVYNGTNIYNFPYITATDNSCWNLDTPRFYYSTDTNTRIKKLTVKRCPSTSYEYVYFDTQTKKIITPTHFLNPDNNKFYWITTIATVYNISTDWTLTPEANGLTLPANFVLPKANQSIYKKNLNGWIYQWTDNNLYFLSTDFTKYKTLATWLNGLVAWYWDFIFYSSMTTNNVYSLDHCNSTTCWTATSWVLVQEQYKLKDNLTLTEFIWYIKETNNYIFLDNQNILYSSSPLSSNNMTCIDYQPMTFDLQPKQIHTLYLRPKTDYFVNTSTNHYSFKNISKATTLQYYFWDFSSINYYDNTWTEITDPLNYSNAFFSQWKITVQNTAFTKNEINIKIYSWSINNVEVLSDDTYTYNIYWISTTTWQKTFIWTFETNTSNTFQNNYFNLFIEFDWYNFWWYQMNWINLRNYEKVYPPVVKTCLNPVDNQFYNDWVKVDYDLVDNVSKQNLLDIISSWSTSILKKKAIDDLQKRDIYTQMEYWLNDKIPIDNIFTSCNAIYQNTSIWPFEWLADFWFWPVEVPLTDLVLSFYPLKSVTCPLKSIFYIYNDITTKF